MSVPFQGRDDRACRLRLPRRRWKDEGSPRIYNARFYNNNTSGCDGVLSYVTAVVFML